MEIKEPARSHPQRDLPSGSPAPYASTRCSRQARDPGAGRPGAPASPSSPARAPRGTHTRWARRSSSLPGCGWAQREGGPVEEIRPGDVVWFPPGEKHWHGATPTTAMTHIAIQEKLDGKIVDWMEHVSDEQYRSGENKPR